MWGRSSGLGTTVYLTENRQSHAATIATFDFQSKKEDSETKVGNAMNLEGGIGGDFLKGGLTTGLDYYASFKLSDDRSTGCPEFSSEARTSLSGRDRKCSWRSRRATRCTAFSR